MGRVEGKVAFITGAAPGQAAATPSGWRGGRGHHRVDLAAPVDSVPYPMAIPADPAQTVTDVEALDRRITATQADVRDYGALKRALDEGVADLGRLDIVGANEGICSYDRDDELAEETLAGHDRYQPDRRPAYGQGRGSAPAGRGAQGLHHPGQLCRGTDCKRERRPLYSGQARRCWPDADAGAGAGPGHDPG